MSENINVNGPEEEYKSLKSEITENSKAVLSIFLANSIVTTLLFGYALQNGSGPVFLTPFIILIPSIFFIASRLESTVRISQYLRIFLEPLLDRSWQARRYELAARDPLPNRRNYTFIISSLYGVLALACLFLAYFNWSAGQEFLFVFIAAPLALLMFLGIYFMNRALSKKLLNNYADNWTTLKRQLDNEEKDRVAKAARLARKKKKKKKS